MQIMRIISNVPRISLNLFLPIQLLRLRQRMTIQNATCLKVTSGLETLSTTEKDSWGVEYSSGFQIFRGYYYDNSRKDLLTYKLIQRKPAIVPALSLLFICADVEAKNKVTISEETHLNILSVLDNMN